MGDAFVVPQNDRQQRPWSKNIFDCESFITYNYDECANHLKMKNPSFMIFILPWFIILSTERSETFFRASFYKDLDLLYRNDDYFRIILYTYT